MKCPKCGLARSLEDRVCRRCKCLFDEDRFIGVEPPRAGASAPGGRRWRELALEMQSRPRFLVFASLLPGLGHTLAGNPRRGLLLFGIVLALAVPSALLFSTTVGQMLFGLAVSAHAYAVFDVSPWSRAPEPRSRGLAMGLILGALLVLYWPLLGLLADRFVRPGHLPANSFWVGLRSLGAVQILFMAAFFIASLWFSVWLARRLSSRQPGRDA
jgi:hypothetical protein